MERERALLFNRSDVQELLSLDECIAAVEYVLSLGGNVNTVDKNGETAMHGAAYKSLPKMVTLLAAKGADIAAWNQKNKSGPSGRANVPAATLW